MKLTYTLSSESWPEHVWKRDRDHVDELSLSVAEADGFYGDFSLRWVDLGNRIVPLFRAFSDSWSAAAFVMPILEQFNDADPTPAMVIAALEENGWRPSTYHGQEKPWRESQ